MSKTKKRKVAKPVEVWEGMTRARLDAIGKYFRWCADTLNLRDWMIVVSHASLAPDDDALACVDATYGRRHATITLSWNFAGLTREEQRHVIVHELVHLLLEPGMARLRKALPQTVGEQTAQVILESVRLDNEYAVDGITDMLAKTFPLPKGTTR